MDTIESAFRRATRLYNNNQPHLDACRELVRICLAKLSSEAYVQEGWQFGNGENSIQYVVYRVNQNASLYSRPWVASLHITDASNFESVERSAIAALSRRQPLNDIDVQAVTLYVYTAVMGFSCCYDLWKPGSRKTPGTFFELLMAALMSLYLQGHTFSKHVDLGQLLGVAGVGPSAPAEVDAEAEASSLSTDLVVQSSSNSKYAVIPLKITTRERIVQPFAHQRILESAFPGQYSSFICCISETQLDKVAGRTVVKQVCVPGTVRLFQRFLAHINGLYYCDIPVRYARNDLTRHIPVKPVGALFDDVKALLDS